MYTLPAKETSKKILRLLPRSDIGNGCDGLQQLIDEAIIKQRRGEREI